MDNQSTPDWAIIKAYRICHPKTIRTDAEILRITRKGYQPFIFPVAKYVMEHEKPPVDPDLVLARELCAKEFPHQADFYKRGNGDGGNFVPIVLEGIKQGKRIGVG